MNEMHLTPIELAARLHRSISCLAHWRVDGKGPAYIPGRPILYPVSEVEKWEANHLRLRPVCDQREL